jgi:SnoaL-like domain
MPKSDGQVTALDRSGVDDAVQQLLHLEAIRLLRPRYCRIVDLKLWGELEDLLTEDYQYFTNPIPGTQTVAAHNPGAALDNEPVVRSASEFRVRVSTLTDGAATVHSCFNPEIEILADQRGARGIWAMHDVVTHPAKPALCYTGYGHYYDEYRLCDDGRWRISKAIQTRLRMNPLPVPPASD